MGKEKKLIPSIYYIFATIAAIIVIVLGIPEIYTLFEPDLKATANGGDWNAHSELEKELKGMVKVSHLCKNLKGVIGPNLNVEFQEVNDLSLKIIGEIEDIEPCEANNVESLRTMYTIEVENNGKTTSNRIILEIMDAKYVHYENYGKSGTKTGDFRDNECRIVPMGRLERKGRILAKAWVISSVSPEGCFKILQEGRRDDVPLYMAIPVGNIAEWVNEYSLASLILMLSFISLFCVLLYRIVMKIFPRKKESPSAK